MALAALRRPSRLRSSLARELTGTRSLRRWGCKHRCACATTLASPVRPLRPRAPASPVAAHRGIRATIASRCATSRPRRGTRPADWPFEPHGGGTRSTTVTLASASADDDDLVRRPSLRPRHRRSAGARDRLRVPGASTSANRAVRARAPARRLPVAVVTVDALELRGR